MARGSKKKYTSKQKRKAHHIEKGYEKRGVTTKEAERRAWATVNKSDKKTEQSKFPQRWEKRRPEVDKTDQRSGAAILRRWYQVHSD